MYQHILVPVDDSDLSVVTASKATCLAKSLGARVTFVHARADFGATDDGALVRVMSPAEFAEQAPGKANAILAKVEVDARVSGVSYQLVAVTGDRPYEVIIETATQLGCDLIFMASHGRRGLRGLFVGSQTQKVLAHATIPVLVASVEGNSISPEMDAAMSVIKGEHRSLAAVMTALRRVLGLAQESAHPVNSQLIRAMVFYVRKFPQTLHHPKEEHYLFSRLRGSAAGLDDVLAQLESQHREEDALIGAVDGALSDYEAAPSPAHLKKLAEAADHYCERLWAHMSLEEKVVLPACQKILTPSDWVVIAQAFEANGDPRFDKEHEDGFDAFLTRIMNVAAQTTRN